jgi:flagellar motility protein MotE (MotC chaperone)
MNQNIRLLPVLILVATLAFMVRMGEVLTGFRETPGQAIAEEKKADEHKTDEKTPADHAAKDSDPAKDTKTDKPGDGKPAKDVKPAEDWPEPTDMDPELADVKNDLLKDLSNRRKQLDLREKQLGTREAVLKAAESEIDQKYRELSELRKQLQGLLNEQSEEEAARIKSLVRIYEGMKPADAARIFNTLDINILLDVMTRMSERKSAPVLAAMDADRARTVTLLMAQQKKLPDLPELGGSDSGTLSP